MPTSKEAQMNRLLLLRSEVQMDRVEGLLAQIRATLSIIAWVLVTIAAASIVAAAVLVAG